MWKILPFFVCLSLCLSGCTRTAGSAETFAARVETPAGENSPPVTLDANLNGKRLSITAPAGSTIELGNAKAKQPTPTDDSATADVKNARATADSGNGAKKNEVAGFGFWTFLVGVILLLLGGVLFLAKRKPTLLGGGIIARAAAVLPPYSGLMTMATGLTVMILPWLLDTISPVIYYAAIAGAVIGLAWWLWNIYQNERDQEQKRRDPFNDADTEIISEATK